MSEVNLNDELYHHGILGMKWGKKNGPPYPLDYKKLSAEERSAAKEKAIRQGNIKEAAENIDYYDNNELRAVKERFSLNQDIKKLHASTIKTGKEKAGDLVDSFTKGLRRATDAGEAGVKAYNFMAKAMNSFSDDDNQLPLIGEKKAHKNKAEGKSKGQMAEMLRLGNLSTKDYEDIRNRLNAMNEAESGIRKNRAYSKEEIEDIFDHPEKYSKESLKEASDAAVNFNKIANTTWYKERENMREQRREKEREERDYWGFYHSEEFQNELYHHGVDGMKWGKRNGPPYPLDKQGKAELRAQKKAAKAERKELGKQVEKTQEYKNNKKVNALRAHDRLLRDGRIGSLGGAAAGAAIGGLTGATVGLFGGMVAVTVSSAAINAGRKFYENSKYKNMKVSELQEQLNAKKPVSHSYGDELYHHGVLGMKWGVRRYQNPDGTLTSAGIKRYRSMGGSSKPTDLATGKGVQNRLNDVDQATTMHIRNKKKSTRKASKLEEKIRQREYELKRSKSDQSSDKKMTKLKEQVHKENEKIKSSSKMIDKGHEETWKLLARASEMGYDTNVKYTVRYAHKGKLYTTYALGGLVAAVPYTLLVDQPEVGYKYKLSKTKNTNNMGNITMPKRYNAYAH